jgi:ornithine cyclodeaminase
LRFVRDAAQELGLGQLLSLIPELANPKDLFSLVRPALSATPAAPTRQASADADAVLIQQLVHAA